MESKDITTLEQLCDYILEYHEHIYVREQINGKWGSHSLKELPTSLALKHALRFIKEGRIPTRLRTEEELQE